MPCRDDMPWQTALSLVSTQSLMQYHGLRFEIGIQPGNSLVAVARNHLAHKFLSSEYNRLLFVDSDIVWDADSVLRLLAQSTHMECVSGAYVCKNDKYEFQFGNKLPDEPNEHGCYAVNGLGLGFTCVTRRVMETLAERAPLAKTSATSAYRKIFREDINEEGFDRGEDMAFFADVRALGVQPYVDPKINLGHVGRKVYQGSLQHYLANRKVEA